MCAGSVHLTEPDHIENVKKKAVGTEVRNAIGAERSSSATNAKGQLHISKFPVYMCKSDL